MTNQTVKFEISKLKDNKLNIVNISNFKVGIFFINQNFFIFKMICPHLGGDLCDAKIDYKKKTIQCGVHGYIFSMIDGELIKNPNLENTIIGRLPDKYFDPNIKDRYRLTKLDYKIEDEHLIINY